MSDKKKVLTDVPASEAESARQEVRQQEPLEIWYGYPIRPGKFNINGVHVVEDGGVSFTVHSEAATSIDILLFANGADEPEAIIPYPSKYRIGDVYSMIIYNLDIENLEYCFRVDGPWNPERGLIFDKNKAVIDQYARKVEIHGDYKTEKYPFRAKIQVDNFDWGASHSPDIPEDELIIYETHVRGFTKNSNSGVEFPGTFAGLEEKIPYLKALGVNVVELMPVFEFDPEADLRKFNGNKLLDYWGYNPAAFFAVNNGYNSRDYGTEEGYEFKSLVKALHDNGMEVFLDVVFNHTVEGNENGPYISFKGLDNQIYYMLTPEGFYYNFSGCGNTLNCNHPVVRQMILECLRFWVTNYRIDGFRFDLASILGRDEEGAPLSNPPLLESLAYDPILKNVQLIAEAWDAGGLYQVGSFPAYTRWSEWNGRYRDDMRQFLKGDRSKIYAAAQALTGSKDIYPEVSRGKYASVNFLTAHDGFTLNDLYSYNEKHNEANGWNNTDGEDFNNSWNCGVEGATDDQGIIFLREKMMLNACVVLLSSFGIPMFVAGDEFANTQFGNNNPYCQDNEISWLDWSLLDKNKHIYNFWQKMISFRKHHPILRDSSKPAQCGLPATSLHGFEPWYLDTGPDSHFLGIMYAGRNEEDSKDEVIYLAINTHWESHTVNLPELPHGEYWREIINTNNDNKAKFVDELSEAKVLDKHIHIAPRSVILLLANVEKNQAEADKARDNMVVDYVQKQKDKEKLFSYYINGPVVTGTSIAWAKPLSEAEQLLNQKRAQAAEHRETRKAEARKKEQSERVKEGKKLAAQLPRYTKYDPEDSKKEDDEISSADE